MCRRNKWYADLYWVLLQKVARFNKEGSMIAVGTTDGAVTVFKYPSMETLTAVDVAKNEDILDVDINPENAKLTCVLANGLKLINLRGKSQGTVIQTVSAATIDKKRKLHFRSFR